MAGLGRIFRDLWILLPHWAVGVLVAVTAIALVPGWRFRRRTTRVREAVRQMVRAEPETLARLTAVVWEVAGTHPDLLATAVREARKRDQPKLANEAMARLDTIPAGAALAAQLRAEVTRPARDAGDVLSFALRIETMIADDRVDAARLALHDALTRWPDDPHLARLRDALPPVADAPPAQDMATSR